MKEHEHETDRIPAGRKSTRHRYGVFTLVLALIAAVLGFSTPTIGAQDARVVVEEGESIQAAIDAAAPGTRIIVRGDHVENLVIQKDGIWLYGEDATLRPAETGTGSACAPDPSVPIHLICVTPDTDGGPAEPDEHLDGFTITGFTLEDAPGDAIATVFVNDVRILRNTVNNASCDGIFVIFADGINIRRNDVDGSGCSGINVNAGANARIVRNWTNDSTFSGITVNDVTETVIRRNIAMENCLGISVADGNDGGFGIGRPEFPGDDARIIANTANNNNKTCPFGEGVVGASGIAIGGVDNVVIKANTTDNNTTTEETITVGGIFVNDFPNFDGSLSPTTNVSVIANRAVGNSTAAGPVDVLLVSESILDVRGNHCDVSAPDSSVCD